MAMYLLGRVLSYERPWIETGLGQKSESKKRQWTAINPGEITIRAVYTPLGRCQDFLELEVL